MSIASTILIEKYPGILKITGSESFQLISAGFESADVRLVNHDYLPGTVSAFSEFVIFYRIDSGLPVSTQLILTIKTATGLGLKQFNLQLRPERELNAIPDFFSRADFSRTAVIGGREFGRYYYSAGQLYSVEKSKIVVYFFKHCNKFVENPLNLVRIGVLSQQLEIVEGLPDLQSKIRSELDVLIRENGLEQYQREIQEGLI